MSERMPKPPTLSECKRWREMAENATPGPWKANEWYGTEDGGWCAVGPHHFGDDDDAESGNPPDGDAHEKAKRDATFIAESRTAVPRLVEAYERLLRAAWEAVKVTHEIQGASNETCRSIPCRALHDVLPEDTE